MTLKDEAQSLRSDGRTIDYISKKLGISHYTLRPWMKEVVLTEDQKYNIYSNGKYQYNVKLFTNPNELTYYLLGAFITDGCIDKNHYRSQISSKDRDWLETIENIVSVNGLNIRKSKNTNCFVLQINNKYITKWFIDNECIPNKSLTVKLPTIPNEHFHHFVRGVFDGDGSICISKQKNGKTHILSSYIIGASELFMRSLFEKLNDEGLSPKFIVQENKNIEKFGLPAKDYATTCKIQFNGTYAVEFHNFIYKNKHIYLNRKYEKFQEYLKMREQEIKTCQIRVKFDNPQKIIELLKTHSYNEVGAIVGMTGEGIAWRLKKLGLFKPNRKY